MECLINRRGTEYVYGVTLHSVSVCHASRKFIEIGRFTAAASFITRCVLVAVVSTSGTKLYLRYNIITSSSLFLLVGGDQHDSFLGSKRTNHCLVASGTDLLRDILFQPELRVYTSRIRSDTAFNT